MSSTSSSSTGSSATTGSAYTADLGEAVARVDAGEFDGAFLLRATRIEDVFERARRGEVMPQKTTYFFPKLTSGLLFHPGMTPDWLSLCRDCVADIDAVLERLPTRAEREPVLRAGEGGDDTTAIDAAAEEAVVARLEALQADFTLVSEELGERTFGAGGPVRVVVDPIDGSINAKRGIPFFSLSLAVADGPAMGDVTFGYVYDFGAREEWVAERGRGAFLTGGRSRGRRRRARSRSSPSRGRRRRTSRRAPRRCSASPSGCG